MGKHLTRDHILKQRARLTPVEVEAFDGVIHVKQLSGMERVHFQQAVTSGNGSMSDAEGGIMGMTRLIQMTVRNADGTHMFSEADMSELANSLTFMELEELFKKCMVINGLDVDAIETETKN